MMVDWLSTAPLPFNLDKHFQPCLVSNKTTPELFLCFRPSNGLPILSFHAAVHHINTETFYMDNNIA
jgi:hypothetical protein